MKIWSFTICYNEARMLPWFLRSYEQWVDKMIFFDDKSDDGSREIIKAHPKAELRDWEFNTGLDDEKFRFATNNWYKEAIGNADWVIWPDIDEILIATDPLKLLSETKFDMIGSTGYALISPDGFPKDDGKSQIYDLVKTGVYQHNYSKWICHRPTVNVTQAHGRHVYPSNDGSGVFQWPKCSGSIDHDPKFRLLHCHYVGGIDQGSERNKRNFERANEKHFAWNVADDIQENKDQPGTNAWVREAIVSNKLVDCVTGFVKPSEVNIKMARQIQIGTGAHELPAPWENTDIDTVDISKPLPFPDGCASHLYLSHVLEHVDSKQAWNFIQEAYRVLMPRGVIRIVIPDLTRIWEEVTDEYKQAVKNGGHGDGSAKSCVRACIFEHGHLSVWNRDLLATVLQASGFQTNADNYGESTDPVLRGIDGHGCAVGESVARVESSIIEGVKL